MYREEVRGGYGVCNERKMIALCVWHRWSSIGGGVYLLDPIKIGENILEIAKQVLINEPFNDYFVRICMELAEHYAFELNRVNRIVLSEPHAQTLALLELLKKILKNGFVNRFHEYRKLFEKTLEFCLSLEEPWYPNLSPSRELARKVYSEKLYYMQFQETLTEVREKKI